MLAMLKKKEKRSEKQKPKKISFDLRGRAEEGQKKKKGKSKFDNCAREKMEGTNVLT